LKASGESAARSHFLRVRREASLADLFFFAFMVFFTGFPLALDAFGTTA
jgi:hypothetical protein